MAWPGSTASIERGALAGYHLLPAARADLLRRLGRRSQAAASYRTALALVRSPAERLYLQRRLDACAAPADAADGTPQRP